MNRKTKILVKAACDYLDAEEIAAFRMVKPVSPPRSPEYVERIKKLFEHFEEPPKKTLSHRAKIGLLIAATILATLLTACAVFHEQIGNFFVERKAGRLDISSNTGSIFIEQHYLPSYLPEGYQMTEETRANTITHFTWARNNESIIFKQKAMGAGVSSFDSEGPDAGTMILAGREVIYNRRASYFACVWEDGSYSFTFICPSSLPDEEIERIILSIAEYTPDTK